MPPYAGPPTPRLGDAAGSLKLLAYLAASIALVVLDHRGGYVHLARQHLTAVTEPLRAVAGVPGQLASSTVENVGTVSQLAERNVELRRELLLAQARIARLSTVIADNSRLRALLDAAQRGGLDAQLAPILDVDLDPTRQRIVLDAGHRQAVRVGQSVIDAQGLIGQVTRVGPLQSDVLLITDPDHAVPVAIARNGVRLVAYGTGRNDLLSLASVPLSSDVKVGDMVVTSGLGGRFPAGFPVGRIVALRPDESRAFLTGDVRPAAQLDRGREVLLLRSAPLRVLPPPVVGTTPIAGASPTVGAGADPAVQGATSPASGTTTAPDATPLRTSPSTSSAPASATGGSDAAHAAPAPSAGRPAGTAPPAAPPAAPEGRR
ncbi:rod shape-determining protein MreC [Lysobacter humi (ex Lee et al. 2017)]